LALALAAHPIRIEAPIPGKSLVGIEVPNKVRSIVTLRNLISQTAYQNATSPLLVALGRNVAGAPVYTDITEGPHVLVAGATGTGKTIFLNTLILSLLYKCTPENLRMIMVDPKRVEFQNYNDIPHLLCPVIYDAQKTINALQWLTREMERRFEVFSEIPTRNLHTYNQNKTVIANGLQLPYIVFVVDELADLMAAKGRDLEAGIVRLAQMARATGIHLVLATQRPSVEVITGLIKANVPTRITFQVSSQVDSRTVIDTSGAEKLLGAGDMLFLSAKSAKIGRIQGPYISEKEVKKVSDFIVAQKDKFQEPQSALVQNLSEALETPDPKEAKESGGGDFMGGDDPLFEEVKKIVLETKKASASFLQRRLRIGYSRAARLIDMLEEEGIVGPADGAKPREVHAEHASFTNKILGSSPDESEETASDDGWQKV
jgi:S-DNA-T family DNA segregation ATPase FtsK/SpoIIIE